MADLKQPFTLTMQELNEPEKNTHPAFLERQNDLRLRPFFLVEANLASLPWVDFDRNHRNGKSDGHVFRYQEIVDGTILTCTVTVAMPKVVRNGELVQDTLPTQFDHDVYFCITDLWDEQGRPADVVVFFRVGDICKRLQINTDSGKNYEMVKSAINRLSRVVITSQNAFYSADENTRIEAVIDLMKSVTVTNQKRKIDLVKVELSAKVLANLNKNHTAKINRVMYQRLEHGFSKRLFNLVTTREQINKERGVFDFELFNLAEILPIKGAKYVSEIKNRLRRAVKELQTKNIFFCEFIRQSKNHEVLRLIPVEKSVELIGSDSVLRFTGMIYEIYGKSIEDILQVPNQAIFQYLKKNTRVIELEGVQYSWIFHALHVLTHQKLIGKWEVRNLGAAIRNTLKQEEIDIPLGIGWKPLHIMQQELLTKIKVQPVLVSKTEATFQQLTEIEKMAENYLNKLHKDQFDIYFKNVCLEKPFLKTMKIEAMKSNTIRGSIKELITKDIINSNHIKLKDDDFMINPNLIENIKSENNKET